MWWFALIYSLNSALPTDLVFKVLAVSIGVLSINILDFLIFSAPALTLLPTYRTRRTVVTVMHPAMKWAMGLFIIAFLWAATVGVLRMDVLTAKWAISSLRNFLIVPVAMYMGYQVLGNLKQCRAIVWIIFLGSMASAIMSIKNGGDTSAELAERGGAFDMLRATALQVAGDTGLLAACLLMFSWISRTAFLPLILAVPSFIIAIAGMFFIPHRSSWLVFAIVCLYAAFWVWPTQTGRKILLGTLGAAGGAVVIAILITIVAQQTGTDVGEWAQRRMKSLFPDSDTREARAWDTRIPGMLFDLEIISHNPFGGGFGIHENMILAGFASPTPRHTPWTSTWAESGPMGFAAFSIIIIGSIVVGLRLARQGTDNWIRLMGLIGTAWGVSAYSIGWFSLSWNSPRQALMLGLITGLTFRCRDLVLTERSLYLPAGYDSEELHSSGAYGAIQS